MIGIIGAMEKETSGFEARMSKVQEEDISGIRFISGILEGKEVVLATCGVGKVFAAMCAQTMILKYSPDLIINTGIAGSLSRSLHVCDVVISSALVEHDVDTHDSFGDPYGFISGLDVVEMEADAAAQALMAQCCDELGISHVSGIVATGDQFIFTDEEKSRIVTRFGAVACEMEGGAIAQICCANKVPFVVTRAISDSADKETLMDYWTVCRIAAERSVNAVSLFVRRF